MYEKLKEYGLYIVVSLIALGLLGGSFLLISNNKKGFDIEEKVITTTLHAISKGRTNEKIQKNKTLGGTLLTEIGDENIGDKKIHKEKMLLLTSQNYDSIIEEGKIISDISQELSEGLNEGEVKYVQIGGNKIEIEGQSTVKSVQLTKDNKVIVGNQTFEGKDLQKIDSNLKGYDGSGYGFGPYTKKEVKEAIDNYFTNGIPVQIGTTDKYIVALNHNFSNNINGKIISKLGTSTSGSTTGGSSSNGGETGGTGTNGTQGSTTVENDKAIIPGTKDGYIITTHVGDQLEKNVKETENILLEQIISNGLKKFSGKIRITGKDTTVLENINVLGLTCLSGFEEQSGICEEKITSTCENPIYLDSNGVTVKAKKCAESGKTYQWNGESWYVARDKSDANKKIFINNGDEEGKGEFKANRVITSKLTNMYGMFWFKESFNQDISNWDTSNVTTMEVMFRGAEKFNQPIGNWNTSNVTNVEDMFRGATSFNQDISNWNTSNITNMESMFHGATSFNQPIGNWDTRNVENMEGLFEDATSFNQPIGNWNTSKVKNMSLMFYKAKSFNQDISNWDTSKVVHIHAIFAGAKSFNQPIGNWNISNITYMGNMFNGATSFNQDISNWNTSNVENMGGLFENATSFNQPIGNWNTSKVTSMIGLFNGATSFNQDISNWNTRNVKNMGWMFSGAKSFNKPIGNWNTSNVTSMERMFEHATSFNQDISNWNTSKVTTMESIFKDSTSFNQPIGNWNTSNVKNMFRMFRRATSFNQDVSNWNVGKVSKWESFSDDSPINGTNKVPAKFR